MIKYPKFLKDDGVIGVTATSSGVTELTDLRRLDNAYKNMEKLGYKIIETSNVRSNEKFVSSSGEERAKEFLELWKDDSISMIAQVRGGEFLIDMLPYLDRDIILNNEPKWVTGYSDSSLLNFYLTTNFNIATATTVNIMKFGMYSLDKSLLKSLEVLKNKESIQESYGMYEKKKSSKETYDALFNLTDKVSYKSLYEDKKIVIKGRLIGGCLEAIASIIGTKYDNTKNFIGEFKEGMLWYLDDFDANPLDLYSKLWQMKEAGWFSNTKGFLIGRTRAMKEIGDFEYLDALHKVFDELNVPVIYDVDIGHLMPTFTIINGSLGTFEYENNKGTLKIEMK